MNDRHYRFRHTVRLQTAEEKLFLVSDFPLKAVRLSPGLRPLFDRIGSHDGAWLSQLHPLLPDRTAEGLALFLDRMARKGFLEKQEGDRPLEAAGCKVSIIIPVRNRPDDIGRCLTSLCTLDRGGVSLEIIVVDDGSTDHTAGTAARYRVTVLQTGRRRGASFCRNLGAARAAGDLLLFLDSDCTAAADWIRELVRGFDDPAVAACGGLVDSDMKKKGLDRYEQVKSSLMMGHRERDSRDEGDFFYLPTCNLAVRKAAFQAVGGFRERLHVGEDVDLCWRLLDRGHAIAYRPSARVFHRHRNTLVDFCARRFDYGTSEPLLQRLHPLRRKRFFIPPGPAVFWALIASAVIWGAPLLLMAALGVLAGDALWRRQTVLRTGLRLCIPVVLTATTRVYASVLYHLCAFGSRYYLLPAAAAAIFLPSLFAAAAAGHLLAAAVQFFILRPKLSSAEFLLYFTLEQASYQTGVWWGCLQQMIWRPVLPRPQWGTTRNPVLHQGGSHEIHQSRYDNQTDS